MIFWIFQTTLPLVARSGFAATGSLREQDFFDFFLLVGAELHPVAAGIKRRVVLFKIRVHPCNPWFFLNSISAFLACFARGPHASCIPNIQD